MPRIFPRQHHLPISTFHSTSWFCYIPLPPRRCTEYVQSIAYRTYACNVVLASSTEQSCDASLISLPKGTSTIAQLSHITTLPTGRFFPQPQILEAWQYTPQSFFWHYYYNGGCRYTSPTQYSIREGGFRREPPARIVARPYASCTTRLHGFRGSQQYALLKRMRTRDNEGEGDFPYKKRRWVALHTLPKKQDGPAAEQQSTPIHEDTKDCRSLVEWSSAATPFYHQRVCHGPLSSSHRPPPLGNIKIHCHRLCLCGS